MKAQYRSDLMELFGIGFDVHFPSVEGGNVYKHAELWMKDYDYFPADGVNWDGVVANVIKRAFMPYWTKAFGALLEPSGCHITTDAGDTALLWVTRNLDGVDHGVFHTDDAGIFTTKSKDYIEKQLGPLFEIDKGDEIMGFLLGMSYKLLNKLVPNPSIIGNKLTADDNLHVERVPFEFHRKTLYGHHSEQEQDVWAALHHGRLPNGDRAIDHIHLVDYDKYPGPTNAIVHYFMGQAQKFKEARA